MSLIRAALLAFLAGPVAADDVTGDFDYYILALSWQPQWCQTTGNARSAEECAPGTGRGLTVHGLWPQYKDGWPEFCDTAERDPSRRQNAAMGDLMSPGLAAYQWRKHGRCSGLPVEDYFAATRRAAEAIAIPPALAAPPDTMHLSPHRIEAKFMASNPGLSSDGVTIRCRDGALTEVRICLTRDLEPRDCAPDTRRDCRSGGLEILPPR